MILEKLKISVKCCIIALFIGMVWLFIKTVLMKKGSRYGYTWLPDVDNYNIYTVIASNSTPDMIYDRYFIMGQFHKSSANRTMICCILHEGKTVVRVPFISDGTTKKESTLFVDRYFSCPSVIARTAIGATVVRLEQNCPVDQNAYLKPYFTQKMAAGSFAVYAHVAYGLLDPELIIEWMEVQRALGVTKTVVSVDKTLNRKARKILQYYSDIGYLDSIQLARPSDDVTNPFMGRGSTMMVDFGERYRGYTYQAVFDMDEFIIPSNKTTLQELFIDLDSRYPDTDAFKLKTSFHILSYARTNVTTTITIEKFQTRTDPPEMQAPKYIIRSDRLPPGGQQLSVIRKLPRRLDVNDEDAFIHHYRHCRTSEELADMFMKLCTDKSVRTRDIYTDSVIERTRDRIFAARIAIFGGQRVPRIDYS